MLQMKGFDFSNFKKSAAVSFTMEASAAAAKLAAIQARMEARRKKKALKSKKKGTARRNILSFFVFLPPSFLFIGG